MTVIADVPRAPYSLEPIAFPFPALASLAGRAALGGPREVALGCFLVARIVIDATLADGMLAADHRRARAKEAVTWLAGATLPVTVRSALVRLAEATAADDRGAIGSALASVMTVTANHLDPGARLELERLAQTIEK